MKILLSAYQCRPNKGSEYGIGWSWATKLAAIGYEVWVITSLNNQPYIEQEIQINPIHNLHFIYCDNASWLSLVYKVVKTIRLPLGTQLVWQLGSTWWQWDAYLIAKSFYREVAFDLVHHVTTATVRRCSFMGFLGIPFILGPLAGGVKSPWCLRKSYPLIGKIQDFIRDLNNIVVKFNPLMHLTFSTATKIYCRSKQAQAIIPSFYKFKSEVLFDISTDLIAEFPQIVEWKPTEKEIVKVLFVGRFLYWKGIHLGLQAFAQLHQKFPNSRFTLVGSGREQAWLQRLSKQLKLEEAVDWIPWIERKELSSAYLQHDVFLFPSLHDSGGMVVMEALAHGLPVVCLNLGGPRVMVDETCGRVVRTDELSEEAVIKNLCNALAELSGNSVLLKELSIGALRRGNQFAFENVVKRVYEHSQTIS